MNTTNKKIEFLVADTSAFIQNAPLQEMAENIITCQEVINEITNKRQLKRLVVLPYDLIVKEPFSEHIKTITDFSIKTGDYPSLSATDIKVMALTYQLEIEKVGKDHLHTTPVIPKSVTTEVNSFHNLQSDTDSFFVSSKDSQEISEKFENLECNDNDDGDDGALVKSNENDSDNEDENDLSNESEDEYEGGWITPSNIEYVKKQINSKFSEEKRVKVACITTDFAMQNVLKQMNLNIAALDGRIIKQVRTFILRCYACFKTTSIMTKKFCPKCGNNTLKRVAVSLDEKGEMIIHINARRPLTARGKKFSMPRIKGGKHPNNPVIVPDQPIPHNKASRLARTKTNALDKDYIEGYSPFVMRDVTSKSAQLHIRPNDEIKNWMRRNPNENRRRRK